MTFANFPSRFHYGIHYRLREFPMTPQIFGLILLVIGVFDLALAGLLRNKLRKLTQTPPAMARWVVIVTYAMGVLTIVAGGLVIVFM